MNAVLTIREFQVDCGGNAQLANLCGPLDDNLRMLEARTGVRIRRRGDNFHVQGERAGQVESVLRSLADQAKGGAVTQESVHLGIVEAEGRKGDDLPSGAPESGQPDGSIVRTPRGSIRARGPHQRAYLANIHKSDLTFGIGPAGTGKTYLAVACAVEALTSERVQRLVLVRPAVEAGERLGFLPGDLSQKVDPYLRPIYDALYEMLGFDRVAKLLERSVIEVAPLAFMRGRSLNDAFIILDEAQNATPEQMKMFLTRMGTGSRVVITGDVTQIDLEKKASSGLLHIQSVLKQIPGISFVRFTHEDVVRHGLVKKIIVAYDQWETQHAAGGK